MNIERKDAVTFKGKPLTLLGKEICVGERVPDCELTDVNLNPVKLSSFRGKTIIISSVISLDTPVCDQQTHYFNQAATKLGSDVVILTLSMDLPFAQKRWCGASDAKQVITLSDYKTADFGQKFGLLIKEWHLLGRAVFVIDKKGVIQHVQYVKEISQAPDYDAVLKRVEQIHKKSEEVIRL